MKLMLLPVVGFLGVSLFLGCDKRKAEPPDPSRSSIGAATRNDRVLQPATLPQSDGHAGESPGNPLANEFDGQSEDWRSVIDFALQRYKGDELYRFLDKYLDEHARSAGFDRVAFIREISRHVGPGGRFLGLINSLYSSRIDIGVGQALDEISQIGLSEFEKLLVMSSFVTSPIMHNATMDELLGLCLDPRHADEKGFLHSILGEKIYDSLQGKDLAEISRSLLGGGVPPDLDLSGVVERLAQQDDGGEWMKAYADFCQGRANPAAPLIEKYGQRIVASLAQGGSYQELLRLTEFAENSSFKAEMANMIAVAWAPNEMGEVAKWASQAPKGVVRDAVIRELVGNLLLFGLEQDAQSWIGAIDDPKIKDEMVKRYDEKMKK